MTLLRLLKALGVRLFRLTCKAVTIIVRPPLLLLKAVVASTVSTVPTAMHRHRDRVSADDNYASQIGVAVTALVTTVIERAPFAVMVAALLTTWLGTPTTDDNRRQDPAPTSLTARVREQQDRPPSNDPVPLWDRYPFE
jgi:hypothetical protein